MLASDVARTVIATMVAVAIVVLPVVAVAQVTTTVTRRRAPWLLAAVMVLIGLTAGYALLASGMDPALRVVLIVGILVGIGVALVAGRVTVAGLALIAAALPWTLYAGAVVLDKVAAGRRGDAAFVLPPLVAGLVAVVIGVSLIRFHRGYLARHPEAVAAAPPPETVRVWNAASRIALGPSVAGLNAAQAASLLCLIVGTQATAMAGHGLPIIESLVIVVTGSIATGLAAVLAWALAWPPRTRRAFEAFAWLGEWELERFRDLTGGALTPTLANMKRHIRNNAERPEDRWIRADILAATGNLDGAREVAGRIPDDTPLGRAERANYLAYVDWLAGGPGDTAELGAAIATIEPSGGDDRLRVEVALAMAEVRRRITAADADPAAPLRAVRDRIGRRADGVLFAAARRKVAGHLKLAATFIIVVTLIDRATSV